MRLYLISLTSFLASTVIAAPMAELDHNSVDAEAVWTIRSFTRTCNIPDTACSYSFGIQTPDPVVTQCSYTVVTSQQAASRASYNGVGCGKFTISSSWSGQFGEGQGFQTMAVVGNGYTLHFLSSYQWC